ncbi:hypothetical protein TNIN_432851 [Trichonephila inaurata madagascariensis]|uniref:Uncharacterized protein n=1 Tax=Trichonephila inaurata madagascariensis TaxID=2747483 RepID=A0A8X6YF63_9ARAC|nr:hypothetical protein TNIN_98301 [Trichonephila inaurata madagascariensis]GFY71785.1 hypothetical protein TNIN_432851 [Trichonephila inaurata madagascariensis]
MRIHIIHMICIVWFCVLVCIPESEGVIGLKLLKLLLQKNVVLLPIPIPFRRRGHPPVRGTSLEWHHHSEFIPPPPDYFIPPPPPYPLPDYPFH